MLRGSKLLELGSGMAYATWVIHLGLLRGSGRSQAARMTIGVDRHGGSLPARAFQLQERALVHDI
jgi:hypothetical protein